MYVPTCRIPLIDRQYIAYIFYMFKTLKEVSVAIPMIPVIKLSFCNTVSQMSKDGEIITGSACAC